MKVLSVTLTVFLFVIPVHAKYGGGTGKPNDPYQIATAEDLMLLGASPDDYDKHFILTADIDLDPNLPGRTVFDRAVIAPDTNYTSNGFQGAIFTGVFDGNNHKVLRLKITGRDFIGLFGQLGLGAKISNLGLQAIDIRSLGDCVGGLAGWNDGSITTSYSTGTVTGYELVGGLVGYSMGNITASDSTGTVTGNEDVGGLVGHSRREGSITMSFSTGTVVGKRNVGGLVGYNWSGIGTSYSTGTVTAEELAGGLLGLNAGNITSSYSTATATANACVGGLVGYNGGGDLPGSIAGSYSNGVVSGASDVGGLVGDNDGVVTLSFWDMETSGQTISAGGTGKTTSQMQTARTFLEAGWDFVDETANGTEDIWWILEEQSYPRLWWQYGRAFSPHPHDGAIDVTQPLLLSWLPGGSGLYHDIYFGEDKEAMANATTESTEIYRGQQAAEMTSFDPGPLKLDKTYYWRIDEVNEADPNGPRKGYVWRFMTADYLLVDDFESYSDDDGPGEAIWPVWIDGFGIPENGAIVEYCEKFFWWGRRKLVHGGAQSMDIYYDNSGTAYYSESTANIDDLEIGKDWTRDGVGVLSLWFHGDPNNAPEPMYVGLSNVKGPTAAVYHDNPDAVLINEWTEWRIDLQEFAVQGVNLTNVDSISIGFGDKNNPQPDGSGLVFFDDIRLYRPQSVTSYYSEVNEP